MTTDVRDERREPPPPVRLGAWIAVAIELAVVLTFFAHRSVFGLLLCAAYAWFSATWSVLSDPD